MDVSALLARCTFPPPGTEVRCGVSGGADSTALAWLAVAAGCRVRVVHVDHGLRPTGAADADHVAALAEQLGASFEVHRLELTDGPNLEERARDARHAVLGPDALLGHTADDQAETVLLALLRGSGPSGLAGADRRCRPLLGLRRSDTVAVCEHAGLSVLHDPTNDSDRFRRNRVRHELLPLLNDIGERDLVPLLVRIADQQSEVASLLDHLAATVDPTDAAALAALPELVAGTALRHWWARHTGIGHPPDQAAIRRILSVAAGERVACDVVAGWEVRRSGGRLQLRRRPGTLSGDDFGT